MKNKKKTPIIIITAVAAGIILLACFLLSFFYFKGVKDPKTTAENGSGTVESGEESLPDPDGPEYLFVGNSLSYYNNSPEMFRNLVKAGTGKSIAIQSCMYGGRTLEEHVHALEAVVRTQGDEQKLTETEKTYFYNNSEMTFSPDTYKGYVRAFWDTERDRPIRYSHIVLQIYYKQGKGDADEESIADSVSAFIRLMDSPETTYIVESTIAWYNVDFETFMENQDTIDRIVREGVEKAEKDSKGHFRDILISLYGRSFCNYLCQYGFSYAQDLEPEAYDIYRSAKGVLNDLMYYDKKHPTQLGSYLSAATLYSLMHGNPEETVDQYAASVSDPGALIDGTPVHGIGAAACIYNDGDGFQQKEILTAGARIAWMTQKEGLKLEEASSDAEPKNGLYKVDGVWKYYEQDVFTEKTGIALRPDNQKWYYIEDGIYKKATGLAKRVTDGKWFYVEDGTFKKATGVAARIDNGMYYYVSDGKYDNTFNGRATGITDGADYIVTDGKAKPDTSMGAFGGSFEKAA